MIKNNLSANSIYSTKGWMKTDIWFKNYQHKCLPLQARINTQRHYYLEKIVINSKNEFEMFSIIF